MKAWELNRRTSSLSEKLKPVPCEGIRIDFDSFPEPEKQLISKVLAIKEEYGANIPKEFSEENNKLLGKFFEVVARRIVDLFVDVLPMTLCADEVEQWCFKLHFYNFLADFAECFKHVHEWPDEEREEFLKFLKETGTIDRFFRFPRGNNHHNSAVTDDAPEAGAANHE